MNHLISKIVSLVAVLAACLFAGVSFTQAYSITDDPTGGDCTKIGTWDDFTKTCTLTKNVNVYKNGALLIISDDITLDGDGFLVSGKRDNIGVRANDRKNIVIKNIHTSGLRHGVKLDNTENSVVENSTTTIQLRYSDNNTIQNNFWNSKFYGVQTIGVELFGSNNNEIIKNKFRDISTGIQTGNISDYNKFTENILTGNNKEGMSVYGVGMEITDNILEENKIGMDLRPEQTLTFLGNVFTNNITNLQMIIETGVPVGDFNIDRTNTLDGKIFYYISDVDGGVFGKDDKVGGFYCVRCNNVTIKNSEISNNYYNIVFYETTNSTIENVHVTNTASAQNSGVYLTQNSTSNRVINSEITDSATGIKLYNSSGNVFENNTFSNDRTGVSLDRSGGNTIVNNTFLESAYARSCAIKFYRSGGNTIYNNNFYDEKIERDSGTYSHNNTFSKNMPIGGNYWVSFDEESEGCIDSDDNGVCDGSHMPSYPYVDYHPYNSPNGWSNTPPELSYSTEKGYDDAGLEEPEPFNTNPGLHPDKGTANKDELVFKVVYTDLDNDIPGITVHITNLNTGGTSTHAMEADPNATTTLRDSDYTNGEQFQFQKTFDKGHYSYYLNAFDGTSTTTLPATGELQLGFTAGYSNVAFLPGIQGSRLYGDGAVGTEDKLWLPNTQFGADEDVRQLAFDKHGASLNDVWAQDENIIKRAYLLSKIYSGFPEFMDDLQSTGVINEWKPIAYDWRLDYFDILNSGVKRNEENISYLDTVGPEDTPYVIAEIQKLIESSDTGRVTIIAHSNGGLLAKTLLSELQKTDNAYHELFSRVDKLVLIASPQLGTPKAIQAMLHGSGHTFDSTIGKTIVGLRDDTWRFTSRNMPMAYDLLPSNMYTELMSGSASNTLLVFDESLDTLEKSFKYRDELGYDGKWIESIFDYRNGATGTVAITKYEDLVDFLLGKEGRPEPEYKDTRHPVKLEKGLITIATSTHEQIDIWMPPDENNDGKLDIEVIQIAGWGRPETLYGIEYVAVDIGLYGCKDYDIYTCVDLPSVEARPLTTSFGDETVVLQSAVPMPVETWYVDLKKLKKEGHDTRKHATIMAAQPVTALLNSIIQELPKEAIPYTSTAVPSGAHIVRFGMHSPVDMHVYDADGNHTGATTTEDGFAALEENIPGSAIIRFGESVYIFLDADKTYSMKLDGTGNGTFTFNIKETLDDQPIDEVMYKNIPVTENSLGSITVGAIKNTGPLTLDYDGDGAIDLDLDTGEDLTASEYLTMLNMAISNMKISHPVKQSILAQIKSLEQILTLKDPHHSHNEKQRKKLDGKVCKAADRILDHLEKVVKKYIEKEVISEDDRIIILRFIGNIREKLVE